MKPDWHFTISYSVVALVFLSQHHPSWMLWTVSVCVVGIWIENLRRIVRK